MGSKEYKVAIDQDHADKVTLENLKGYLALIRRQLRDHRSGAVYLHPEDMAGTEQLIKALRLVITHFTPYKK